MNKAKNRYKTMKQNTYDDCIEMFWEQRRYKRTVQLDPITNTGTIYGSPG
jgi:hypothetical protein